MNTWLILGAAVAILVVGLVLQGGDDLQTADHIDLRVTVYKKL